VGEENNEGNTTRASIKEILAVLYVNCVSQSEGRERGQGKREVKEGRERKQRE
jgi:hypothetical protein